MELGSMFSPLQSDGGGTSTPDLAKLVSLQASGIDSFNVESPRKTGTPILALTRELAQRRKTIIQSFCLTAKANYDNSPDSKYNQYYKILTEKGQERYSEARIAYEQGDYEKCLVLLCKAITLEPHNVYYYVLHAETYLQLCDFKTAILNYKRICILWPDDEEAFNRLAYMYFLHGQCYYDEEMYIDALECFTKASEMVPDNKTYQSRSIACLASLKRHTECLGMVNKRLGLESSNPDLFILRARLHLLFNNSALSYFDVKEALAIDPQSTEAGAMQHNLEANAEIARNKAIQLDLDGKTKEAISKISYAIESNPDEKEYHVLRASMHRRNNDFNASVDDLLLAVNNCSGEEDKELFRRAQHQLLLTFNDFAVHCFKKGFYEEAIVLLEKAIKGEKNDASLYCNRGDCFYKLGHLHFALLDYQQAEEICSSERSITLRLSVVYNELGILEYTDRKYYRAEDYFSLAISHNPRISNYYLSRCRARYMQENIEEAQVDIILALYLESSNKEAFSMFARLFSGKAYDEVMQSSFTHLVIEALHDVIKDSDKQHGERTGIHPNLTDTEDLVPNKRSVSKQKREEVMAQCMDEKEFHYKIITGKKMVNQLVESVIQSRQDLSYTGPTVAEIPKKKFHVKETKSMVKKLT